MRQLAVLFLLASAVVAFRPSPLESERISSENLEKGGRQYRTHRPLIGILTQPGDLALENGSYFSAGYAKWLESAGARVVPILYDLNFEELDKLFSIVNGILIPGGNYPLTPYSTWFKTADFLFDRVKQANRNGDPVTMHGTCLGFELLITLITRSEDAIVELDAHNHPAPLQFTALSETSSFARQIPTDVIHDMENYPINMHNHHFGFVPQSWDDYRALNDFFKPLAHTWDKDGVKYVSMIEAYDYPITGIAFHPEKVMFEWTTEVDIPHNRRANDAAYALAQAFVSQSRLNDHRGADIVEEDRFSLYNFLPIFRKHNSTDEKLSFEQVYLFNVDEYRSVVGFT